MQTRGGALLDRDLTGITLYEPAELVIAARAGTPLSEVERTLAEKGQELPFEPMDYRAAARHAAASRPSARSRPMNISGPRRIMAGAARDSLIGVALVNGRGEVVKSGGRVMKNVTGLDLVKLLAGSWGTLGFLTEVTFKVLPQTERMATLVWRGLDDRQAIDALSRALGSPFEVTRRGASSRRRSCRAPRTLMRLEGFSVSVDYRLGEVTASAEKRSARLTFSKAARRRRSGNPSATRLSGRASDRAVWRISTAPSKAPDLAARIGARLWTRTGSTIGAAVWCGWRHGPSGDAGRCARSVRRCGIRRPRDAGARARRGPGCTTFRAAE